MVFLKPKNFCIAPTFSYLEIQFENHNREAILTDQRVTDFAFHFFPF